MIFENTYTIGMEQIGLNNCATNQAILSIMEDVGGLHSAQAGYGVMDIAVKERAWVLLDWQVRIFRRPVYNERINAATWSRKIERACAYRDFELRDQAGAVTAIGTSRWVLMDTIRRRPVRLTEELAALYRSEENRRVFQEEMTAIQYDEKALAAADRIPYTVLRRDIDINRHMHNINYLEAAYEVLPQSVYEAGIDLFQQVRIRYKREIKYGDPVKCAYLKQASEHLVLMLVEEQVHAVVAFR